MQEGIYAWGGETISVNDEPVGETSSVGYSPLANACVALGYVRGEAANQLHVGTHAQIDLWGERIDVRLHDKWPA